MHWSKYPSVGILGDLCELAFGLLSRYQPKKPVSRGTFYRRLEKQGMPRRLFSRRLSWLSLKGYIGKTNDGSVYITERGKDFLTMADISNIILRNKKMDGHRRLIIFDIPEERRSARDVLRTKLKEFECKQLQKSVYLTPYICESEIKEVAKILRVEPFVHVLKVFEI